MMLKINHHVLGLCKLLAQVHFDMVLLHAQGWVVSHSAPAIATLLFPRISWRVAVNALAQVASSCSHSPASMA